MMAHSLLAWMPVNGEAPLVNVLPCCHATASCCMSDPSRAMPRLPRKPLPLYTHCPVRHHEASCLHACRLQTTVGWPGAGPGCAHMVPFGQAALVVRRQSAVIAHTHAVLGMMASSPHYALSFSSLRQTCFELLPDIAGCTGSLSNCASLLVCRCFTYSCSAMLLSSSLQPS